MTATKKIKPKVTKPAPTADYVLPIARALALLDLYHNRARARPDMAERIEERLHGARVESVAPLGVDCDSLKHELQRARAELERVEAKLAAHKHATLEPADIPGTKGLMISSVLDPDSLRDVTHRQTWCKLRIALWGPAVEEGERRRAFIESERHSRAVAATLPLIVASVPWWTVRDKLDETIVEEVHLQRVVAL